jgi:hypothetical protein
MLTNILKLSWFGIRPTTNRILKFSQNDTVALGKPTCECLSHVDLGFHQRKWFNYEQWVNLGWQPEFASKKLNSPSQKEYNSGQTLGECLLNGQFFEPFW